MPPLERNIELGIAICTHNPDERLLQRTLAAIGQLEIPPGLGIECVVVDNASDRAVADLPCVKAFLSRCGWAKVVVETKLGLTHARVAAIEATGSSILCFVDDDNEPSREYLAAAWRILSEHGCISVLGPGQVVVEYVEPVPQWFAKQFSRHFQERDSPGLAYGSVSATWTDFYPPGSCMVVRRDVLARYREGVVSGRLSAVDRVGGGLTSGGDTQIVWEAVKMGMAAGISSDLRLRHMVPARRANRAYIKRLCYGTSSGYLPALVSSFPSERSRLTDRLPANSRIVWDATKILLRGTLRLRFALLPLDLATFFGALVGFLDATNSKERGWVRTCARLLRLT